MKWSHFCETASRATKFQDRLPTMPSCRVTPPEKFSKSTFASPIGKAMSERSVKILKGVALAPSAQRLDVHRNTTPPVTLSQRRPDIPPSTHQPDYHYAIPARAELGTIVSVTISSRGNVNALGCTTMWALPVGMALSIELWLGIFLSATPTTVVTDFHRHVDHSLCLRV